MSAVDRGVVSYCLARRLMRAKRAYWATGAIVVTIGVALGGLEPAGPSFGVGLALVLGVSLAAAPDPDDLRAGAVFHLVGARRRQRRAVVGWTTVLILLPGTALGLAVVLLGVALGWLVAPTYGFLLMFEVVGVLSSVLAARNRLRAEEVAEAGSGGPLRPLPVVLLAAAGFLMVLGSSVLPRSSTTGSELSLSLLGAWVGVGLGLLALLPALVRGTRLALRKLPLPPARLASGRSMPAMGMSIWLVALGSTVVASSSVVGFGLAARERPRLAALKRYDLRQGTADDQVIVRGGPLAVFGKASGIFVLLGDQMLAAVQATPGLGAAVPVVVPTTAPAGLQRSPGGGLATSSLTVEAGPLGSPGPSPVGLATPELLDSLGASGLTGFVDGGGALVLDPTRIDRGSVTIATAVGYRSGDPVKRIRVRARALHSHRVAAGLPAALVSSATIERLTSEKPQPLLVVARAPALSTAGRSDLLGRLDATIKTPGSTGLTAEVRLGSDPLDLGSLDRTDAPGVSLVRDEPALFSALGASLFAYLLVVAVTTRFVALSRRKEDEVFEVLGAPAGLVPRIAALQAGIVSLVGLLVGGAIGFGATVSGLNHYNHHTRFSSAQVSPPEIPLRIPSVLLVGLAVLPLVSAGVAALMARLRPPLDPNLLGERLATDALA